MRVFLAWNQIIQRARQQQCQRCCVAENCIGRWVWWLENSSMPVISDESKNSYYQNNLDWLSIGSRKRSTYLWYLLKIPKKCMKWTWHMWILFCKNLESTFLSFPFIHLLQKPISITINLGTFSDNSIISLVTFTDPILFMSKINHA